MANVPMPSIGKTGNASIDKLGHTSLDRHGRNPHKKSRNSLTPRDEQAGK